MIFSRLFSGCWLGHTDPVKVLKGRVLHLECGECQADLGPVLPGQKYKARKITRKVRKRKSADVLKMARKAG